MLKRGMNATIEEWLMAAEYVAQRGNLDIVLCERGIRTFETATRNTLDISAVPVVHALSHLPVVVDPSHSGGRRDLVVPLSRAAIAVGADGIIVDVHPHPDQALCDGPQALVDADLDQLAAAVRDLPPLLGRTRGYARQRRPEHLERPRDPGVVDVEMRDQAHPPRADRGDEHAARPAVRCERRAVQLCDGQVERHDVGLDGFRVDQARDARRRALSPSPARAAWSSASRSMLCVKACSPAAASTPA